MYEVWVQSLMGELRSHTPCGAAKQNKKQALEITILWEAKAEKERHISYYITYTWNLKYNTNELMHEREIESGT